METEQKDFSLKVGKLIENNSWIVSEKQLFGRSGSDYDITSRDPHKAREQFESLQAEQSGFEKRVNKKVMAKFEKAEDEYNDLISKKNIIEFIVVSLKERMFNNANVLFRTKFVDGVYRNGWWWEWPKS